MEQAFPERKKMGVRIVIVLAATVLIGVGCLLGWRLLIRSRRPVVEIETSMGTITAELQPEAAPETVANFLRYVDDGFYDGRIFHRVISGFMIQGGTWTPDFTEPKMRAPIRLEARASAPNRRGTLAMARTAAPNSATAGFFINLADNAFLNRDPQIKRPGYCVFGAVIDGMDVVDKIGAVPTGSGGPFAKDVPVAPILIKSIRRVR